MQDHPGARSALLAETSLQGPVAEQGAGALRAVASSRGTRGAPRRPGLTQPLIPPYQTTAPVPAWPGAAAVPSPCAQLCLPKPRWALTGPDKSVWFSTGRSS